MLRRHKLALADLLIQFLIRLTFEGEVAAEEGIQKDPTGPYICRRSQIVLLLHDLRGHVGGRATEDLQFRIRSSAAAKSEIY